MGYRYETILIICRHGTDVVLGCCPPVPLSSLNYALNETFGLGINVTIRGYSTSSLDRSKEFQTIGVPLTIYQSQSQKGDSNAEINLERIITCDIWAWFHDEAISDPNSLKSVVISESFIL